MTKLFIQATTRSGTFCRAGHIWTSLGHVVDPSDFDETELEALKREPNLKVREASKAEIAGVGALPEDPTEAEVIDALMAAIPQLAAGDFTKSKLPDLARLRSAVALQGDLVTPTLRDAAMERLLAGGSAVPVLAKET